MSKQKLVEDPGDRVQGKMPLTADDALSTEKPVLLDELHGTVTSGNVTDAGVARIFVAPLKLPIASGPSIPLSGPGRTARSPMDYVREQNERYAEAHDRALAECPPPLIDYVTVAGCSAFGSGVCVKGSCPAYAQAGDSCRAKKMLPPLELEVGRKWLTRAEFDALPPGTRVGWGDREHEAKLKELMSSYGAAAAAEKKVAEAEQRERDQEILELRQQERTRPRIEAGGPEAARQRNKATYDAARMR